MPKTGENIYKRKDGRWEGRYVKARVEARTRFGYVFGRTYRETRLRLAEARAAWARRPDDALPKPTEARATLFEISVLWLDSLAQSLKESTMVKYRDYLRRYILPRFGALDMNAINDRDVAAFCRTLLFEGGEQKRGLSTKTTTEVLRVVKSLQRYAAQAGYATGYSACGFAVRQNVRPIRIFSVDEQTRLQAGLAEGGTLSHLGVLLCLLTGLRLGELCALRWDDISLAERRLAVRRTLQRIRDDGAAAPRTKIVITEPKSVCSARVIPLPEALCARLSGAYRAGAYFLTGDAEKYVEPRTMQNRFKAILRACGVAAANFHMLRHTFATRCVEAGFDPKCLSAILGHANVNITLNRYVHPTMEMKRKNMEKLLHPARKAVR